MKNKLLFIIPLMLLELVPAIYWQKCNNFLNSYHFSLFDVEQQINFAISHDYNLPDIEGRFFHNKLLQSALDIYVKYTHFIDLHLIITGLSFVGLFGVLTGIWYIFNSKKKNKYLIALILVASAIPFVEVIFNPQIPFALKFSLYFLPLYLLSFYGNINFLKNQQNRIVVIVYSLLVFTSILWILNYKELVYQFCMR